MIRRPPRAGRPRPLREGVAPREGHPGRLHCRRHGRHHDHAGAIVLGLEGFQKERIHGLSISLSTLDEWVGRLSGMSIAERRTLPGMEPGREDLLLQGMILMREIVASLGTDSFVVSTYGARYGVLYERMQRL